MNIAFTATEVRDFGKKETELTRPRKVQIKAPGIVIIPLVSLHEQLLYCTKP